jgi:hypothetical protein
MTGPSPSSCVHDGSAIVGSLVSQLCTFAHSDRWIRGASEPSALSLFAIRHSLFVKRREMIMGHAANE